MAEQDDSKIGPGSVALVTGASRGLGRAIAVALGARGYAVAVNYVNNRDRAESVVKEVEAAGGSGAVFGADVRDEAQVAAMCKDIEAKLGPIDILVANATGPQPFIKLEDLDWRIMLDQLEFFVKSPMLLAKQVVPGMKARKRGRIINIGSEVFEQAVPQFANYVAAKGAQLGLTRSWARELASWQITVNLVAPGWIPTERHDDDPQEDKDAYVAAIPMGRWGEHADIGSAVAFLASQEANFITGQRLSVNGGTTVE
ncbi:SDR family oxidoreductase [Phycisphaeraceae bacterium D3-23]